MTSWSATLDPDADPALTLTADSRSLRVLEGTGGIQALDDEAKAGIAQTIDEEVLVGTPIEFRSTSVEGGRVEGELELAGERHPISFELAAGEDGRFTGSATVKQSDWGMKPYTALFGTLKVADEVDVAFESALVAVDGLRVESALHSRRQGARAVGVQGDVGDRLRVRAVARGDEGAVLPREALRRRSERHAREQLRLVADLAGGARDRGLRSPPTGSC